MHKINVYFFCLVSIMIQSIHCSAFQSKDSLVTTATQLGEHLAMAVKNKSIEELTKDFFTNQIRNQFRMTSIKDAFALQTFCSNHPYLAVTGIGIVSLSCVYSTYRTIKCTIKFAKKRNPKES